MIARGAPQFAKRRAQWPGVACPLATSCRAAPCRSRMLERHKQLAARAHGPETP